MVKEQMYVTYSVFEILNLWQQPLKNTELRGRHGTWDVLWPGTGFFLDFRRNILDNRHPPLICHTEFMWSIYTFQEYLPLQYKCCWRIFLFIFLKEPNLIPHILYCCTSLHLKWTSTLLLNNENNNVGERFSKMDWTTSSRSLADCRASTQSIHATHWAAQYNRGQ